MSSVNNHKTCEDEINKMARSKVGRRRDSSRGCVASRRQSDSQRSKSSSITRYQSDSDVFEMSSEEEAYLSSANSTGSDESPKEQRTL